MSKSNGSKQAQFTFCVSDELKKQITQTLNKFSRNEYPNLSALLRDAITRGLEIINKENK